MHTAKDLKEPAHQEFKIGVTEDQPDEETSQLLDWFQKPAKPPTPDRDWNKTLPDAHGPVQPWLSSLAQMEDPRESFNELMDTPLDFLVFVMKMLKVDTLTPRLLVGPTFKLMKGSCKSLVELEYFFEEVYKATTDQLDWNNPEECRVKCRESAREVYSKRTIITATKLQIVEWHNYKHLDWITVRRDDDKLYKFKADVYYKRESLLLTKFRLSNAWLTNIGLDHHCREDDKLYTFKEGDFKRLRLQDIKDMLILLVQGKLTNLNVE
ncbi:hypothetical protein Tco_0564319 [Tanacetum coccineum]